MCKFCENGSDHRYSMVEQGQEPDYFIHLQHGGYLRIGLEKHFNEPFKFGGQSKVGVIKIEYCPYCGRKL